MINLNDSAYSSDTLEILQDPGSSRVRKVFTSDLIRSAKNVQKQRDFQQLQSGKTMISAAEVISYEEFQDASHLIMPYIEGITGSMFAIHASRQTAQTLSTALSTLTHAELARSTDISCSRSLLLDKGNQIEAKTLHTQLKPLIRQGCAKLLQLPETLIFPLGPCHGDLTLSNVILNPVDGITVIDFLDTFLETPLQDVAKLKQDFIYGWSFRNSSSTLQVKGEVLCKHYLPSAVTQLEQLYAPQVKALTLLCLMRIAPYIKDDVTLEWLSTSLTNCLLIDLI